MTRAAVALLLAVALLPVIAGLGGLAVVRPGDFAALFATPGFATALALSLWTGGAATALALLLAHLALAVAGSTGRGAALRAGALPLLALPHLAVAVGLSLLLAPSGLLLRLLSPWATGFTRPPDWATVQDPAGLALIAGLVVKETPFLLLALAAALAQVPAPRLLVQARTLGYGPLRAWLVAVAPLAQRQVRLPVAAVLAFGIGNVEMALPLGPRTPPTLALLLWQWFTSADLGRRPVAFAGAVVLLGATVAALAVARLLGRGLAAAGRRYAARGHRGIQRGAGRAAMFVAALGPALVAVLGALAAAALLLRSLGGPWPFPAVWPARLDATAWWSAATDLPPLAGVTVATGLVTAALAVLLVLPAAEALHARPALRARVGALLFVPLLLPQLAFLFGLQVLIVRLGVDGTAAAVVWSHLVFALPYVWGVLAPARAALDPRYGPAARLLGAGPVRAWATVTAPLLLRAGLLALALGFAVSAALYLPTLFAGAGRVATLATAAAGATAAGDVRFAAAYAATQALLPLAAFGLALAAGARVFRHRRGVPAA